jgi:hypothetical protein
MLLDVFYHGGADLAPGEFCETRDGVGEMPLDGFEEILEGVEGGSLGHILFFSWRVGVLIGDRWGWQVDGNRTIGFVVEKRARTTTTTTTCVRFCYCSSVRVECCMDLAKWHRSVMLSS